MSKRWDAMSPKESNGKTYWTRVGTMWENKAGNGFNLVLDAIPVPTEGAYRISLFEPKENNNSNNNSSYSSNRPGANRNGAVNHEDDDIPF